MSGRSSQVGLKNEANQHAMIGPMYEAMWQRLGVDSRSFKWSPVDSHQGKVSSITQPERTDFCQVCELGRVPEPQMRS